MLKRSSGMNGVSHSDVNYTCVNMVNFSAWNIYFISMSKSLFNEISVVMNPFFS